MRVFVDTNVLFDIFAQREPFRKASFKLMIMQIFGDIEIWTAPQSYLNIFYVLSKVQDNQLLQTALDKSLERITVCPTTHKDVHEALCAGWNDAEDALIALSCKNVAADYLLTRDGKQPGFHELGIPALTPEEFFEVVKHEHGLEYEEVEFPG